MAQYNLQEKILPFEGILRIDNFAFEFHIAHVYHPQQKNKIGYCIQWESTSHKTEAQEREQELLMNLRSMLAKLSVHTHLLNQASEELNQINKQMYQYTQQTVQEAKNVSAEAQHVEDNMSGIKDLAQNLSEKIQTISGHTDQAVDIAQSAISTIQDGQQVVENLNDSCKHIGKVVDVISEIAQQTNLLAINASIEASHAGRYGKGFAVVAEEIKRLSERTEREITDVDQWVNAILDATHNTINNFNQMKKVIEQINSIQHLISEAVQQQNQATTKIQNQVISTEYNTSLIATNIESVAGAVSKVYQGVETIQVSAENMSEMSHMLKLLSTKYNQQYASEFIAWKEEYSVSIATIDDQHKVLFALINSLFQAMLQGSSKEQMNEILSMLVVYTQYHFKTEEDMFDEFGYEETQNHKNQHQRLLGQVSELVNKFKQGNDLLISYELLDFLRGWLTQHILKQDMKYSSFLIEKGIK